MNLKDLMHQQINDYYDEIVAIRRKLHQVPEIDFDLVQTLQIVCATLDKYQIPYEKCGKAGLKVIIKGSKPGTTTLLRGDMDALPMDEETNLAYKSHNGNMHSCGHDIHTSALLGAVIVLNNLQAYISGIVVCMFQAAEETVDGAMNMIDHGILDGVDEVLATHVINNIANTKAGDIIVSEPGAIMAGTDAWDLVINGYGAHGSEPEEGVSTIMIMNEIFSAWNNLKAREVAPFEAFVLTTGVFSAGSARNILPDSGLMQGTLRTFSPKLRDYLLKRMETLASNIATMYGGSAKLTITERLPATINNADAVDNLKNRLNKFVEAKQMVSFKDSQKLPTLGSEDFSLVLERVPGVFVNISAGDSDYPLHHPKVIFDEAAIHSTMQVFCAFVLGK